MDIELPSGDVLPDPSASAEKTAVIASAKNATPRVTTGIDSIFIEACARSNEIAASTQALTLLFQAEKLAAVAGEEVYVNKHGRTLPTSSALWNRLKSLSESDVKRMIYEATIGRLNGREPGMFIAEAGDFAAITCWEPRFAPPQPMPSQPLPVLKTWNGRPVGDLAEKKPLFFDFNQQIEEAKVKHLYPLLWNNVLTKERNYLDNARSEHTRRVLELNKAGSNYDPRLLYWRLCLTSRNPAKQHVPGAVRAIIEPFVRQFIDDGVAGVWLEAGGVRARDVYGWFGFRTVGECSVGQDQQGEPVITWFMRCTPDSLRAS